MKKFLRKRLKNEKGLTLVELLAVIVILGIIAAIAVPAIGNIIENSRVKAIKADAQNVLAAANIYFVENSNDDEADLAELKAAGFLDDEGSLTTGSVKKGSPNKFTGSGETGGVTVTFTEASSNRIANSSNDERTVSGDAPTKENDGENG